MKYIVFEDFSGRETPIIFPDRILHAELREQVPYAKVVSAGYVHLSQDGFLCSGRSRELGARAREEDSAVIAEHFRAQQD